MVKTKDRRPVEKAAAPTRRPEPARHGPEVVPARPVFSTEARSNGIPASMRAAELTRGAGGAAGRAHLATGMQRSVGNARMGRMMESPAGETPASRPELRVVVHVSVDSPHRAEPDAQRPGMPGQAANHPAAPGQTQGEASHSAIHSPGDHTHAAPKAAPAAAKPHGANAGGDHASTKSGTGANAPKSAASIAPATKSQVPAKPALKASAAAAAHQKATPAAARKAIGPVISAIHHRATGAARHSPAEVPVSSAAAAGLVPSTEQARGAAVQSVANLTSAKTTPVKRDDFKTKLKEAIEHATPEPKTESEADEVVKSGGAKASATVRGQLSAQSDEAAGSLKSNAAPEGDVPPSAEPAPPKGDLVPEPLGTPPAPVAANGAVPAPLPPERLDYSSHRDSTDKAMADSGVTKEQLAKGNEPEFQQNLAARSEAEKQTSSAEGNYRKSEAAVRTQAEGAAHSQLASGLAGFHAARTRHIAKVTGKQAATAAQHARERQQVTDKINEIKNTTRVDVEKILASMDTEADKIFTDGLARAEKAYEDTFEEAKGGVGTWLTTWGDDWKKLIESSLKKARQAYLAEVNSAIDQVSDLVDGKLQAAKQRVEKGRQDVETYVNGLHGNLAKFGAEALRSVEGDFDQMNGEIDQHRDALVEKLTQEYKASYDRMSAMEEKLRAENQSLWDRIYDATVGLIKKILAFKDMLLNVLARAADAIGTIIAAPIDFLGNLVGAGKLGFSNFISHILEHLKAGFMEWLFGAVASTGIELPKNFDLEGILSLVLQILGLTYPNIRSRAVAILGEPVVKSLETAAEVFKILITKGPAGLWEFIKEKIGDLKAMVIEKIKAFVMEKIIVAGITWVIGLLNPAAAFFKACKAIYDIVMFFVEHGQQILDLVNAVINSITAIAKGAIGAAANFVENSLAKTIPVIIGFLAGLLGVGGISDKIKEIIEAIRKPINSAIDWVINKAVRLVKTVAGILGIGKSKDKGGPDGLSDDPNERLKAGMRAAVSAVDRFAGKKVGAFILKPFLAAIKIRYGFKTLEVIAQGQNWAVRGVLNPEAIEFTRVVVGTDKDTGLQTAATVVDPPKILVFEFRRFTPNQNVSINEMTEGLQHHQDALNELTVGQWLANINFRAFLRGPKAAKATKEGRKKLLQQLGNEILMEYQQKGIPLSAWSLRVLIAQRARGKHASHLADAISGGDIDEFDSLERGAVNSYIGSNWGRFRPELEAYAKTLQQLFEPRDREKVRMNFRLRAKFLN